MKKFGIFIASWIVIGILEFLFGFINKGPFSRSEVYIGVVAVTVLLIPLIWAKHSDVKKGFITFLIAYLAFALIVPRIFNFSRDMMYSDGLSTSIDSNDYSNEGTYYIDEGDRTVKLIVGVDKWHCTVKMQGDNGYVAADEVFGYVKDNLLMDRKDHIPIGEINGSSAEITVYSRPSTLYKN